MTFLQVKEPVQLNTVIVDPNADRRKMFGLMLGDRDMQLVDSFETVEQTIAAQPNSELVMLCVDTVIEQNIADINRLRAMPWGILVLLDTPAPSDIEALVAAGADHVLPLRPQSDRFSVATSAALAQARRRKALEQECENVRSALEDVKNISRAKMILMSRHAIGEDEAHRRVQTMSMERNIAMPVMACQIIDAENLLC